MDNSSRYEFDKYIKELQSLDVIHLVLAGAVVSGQYLNLSDHPETIELQNATIYTGLREITMDNLSVPINHVLAWGEGDIDAGSDSL